MSDERDGRSGRDAREGRRRDAREGRRRDAREGRRRDAREGRRLSLRQIGWGAVVALALLFAIVNSQDVKVDYVVGNATWPLWLVIVISAALGAVIDRGLAIRRRRRTRD